MWNLLYRKIDFITLHYRHSGLIALAIVFALILSITWVDLNSMSGNSAYGQSNQSPFPIFPLVPPSNKPGTEVTTEWPTQRSSERPSESSSSSSPVDHGVRIISPSKGQQVPVGGLAISGISKDNATSDCHINIIVNHVRPYQNTSAAGQNGSTDYSNWTFNLTPKYTLIKQGENEITAKFFCNPNPDIASFYSVNVTGVPRSGIGQEDRTQSPPPAPATAITKPSNTTATASNQTSTNVNR